MKKLIIIIATIITLLVIISIYNGFQTRNDVALLKYNFNDDNTTLTLDVTIISSIGYVRDIKVKDENGNKYISFYSTFGILNSRIGAKSRYEIDIDKSCNKIYFYNYNKEYELILEKDEITNEWKYLK